MKQVYTLLFTQVFMAFMVQAQPTINSQYALGGGSYDGFKVDFYLTRDGGVVVGGSSASNKSGDKTQNIRGEQDYWVIKLDNKGAIQWNKTLGGIFNETFKTIIQTRDGGYVLVGESFSFTSVEKDEDSRGASDYWVVKLDEKGEVQWNKTLGGVGVEYLDNVVQLEDGSFILAGSSDSPISGEKSENSRGFFDYWIVKLDEQGVFQWDKTIGGMDYEFGSGLERTDDGGVIVCGFSQSNQSGEKSENSRGGYDYWLVKLDKEGNKQWDKTLGGSGHDFGRDIRQINGGYVVSGSSESNQSGEKTADSRGFYDYWVLQLDPQGQVVKDQTLGGSGDDNEVWCLEKTSDGGYIFGGASNSNQSGDKSEDSRGDYDFWAVKVDKDLHLQWDKTLGGHSYEVLYKAQEVSKDLFLLAGLSNSDISGDKTEAQRGAADFWGLVLKSNHKDEEVIRNKPALSLSKVEVVPEARWKIFPNPARKHVYVQSTGKALYTVTDQTGKIMLTRQINGNSVLDVAAFPAGIYYIKNNSTMETRKFIITR